MRGKKEEWIGRRSNALCYSKLHHITSHCITSYHIMTHHITLYYSNLCHITLHHIISDHITSYHTISYHIIPNHIHFTHTQHNTTPSLWDLLLLSSDTCIISPFIFTLNFTLLFICIFVLILIVFFILLLDCHFDLSSWYYHFWTSFLKIIFIFYSHFFKDIALSTHSRWSNLA